MPHSDEALEEPQRVLIELLLAPKVVIRRRREYLLQNSRHKVVGLDMRIHLGFRHDRVEEA